MNLFGLRSRPVPAIHPSLENEIREFREVYERVNAPLPDEDGVRVRIFFYYTSTVIYIMNDTDIDLKVPALSIFKTNLP